MTSRVLVADDSLTIQKVIGITLANSGYELVECHNDKDLLNKIANDHFDLVLLDFTLSDTSSGYDLAKKVKNAQPDAAIIVMLGTFDSIDDSQFFDCGISDKIIKPFESSKFIKKCQEALEVGRKVVAVEKKTVDKVEAEVEDNLDDWNLDAPRMYSRDDNEEVPEAALDDDLSLDPLSSEMKGWGFTPSINLEDKYNKVFPPVIDEASDLNILDRLTSSADFAPEEEISFSHEAKLNDAIELGDLDATDPSFEIPLDLNRDLLTEIDDVSADDFWAVDGVVPVGSGDVEDIAETNLEEVTADLTEKIQAFKEHEKTIAQPEDFIDKAPFIAPTFSRPVEAVPVVDHDELVAKLKLALMPMIEEMVKELCRQSAEKVAWEVIPDLAENLIRKEIKNISDSL